MRNVVNSVLEKMKKQKGSNLLCERRRGKEKGTCTYIYINICMLLGRKLSKFLLNYFPFLLEVGTTKSLGMMEDVVR